MKATCKLCGQTLETPPDNVFDKNRDARVRTAFFQMVARHIDPTSYLCQTPATQSAKTHQILRNTRMGIVTQDNGWFQRWRLLNVVDTLDPDLVAKKEEWRSYLHAITSEEFHEASKRKEPGGVQ